MDSPQMILEENGPPPPASQMMAAVPSSSAITTPRTRSAPPLLHQVSKIDEPKVKSGIAGASSNLVNAIVGAGIIGIPYAIKESGFVAGVFLLILVGAFTDKSLRLIDGLASFHPKLCNLGVRTYEDLMQIPFGRSGKIFILGSMLVLAYGAMVAYLLIVKDNLPDLFGMGESFVERELIMLVTSLLIMLPLSMLRDISQLAFTSFVSAAADGALVIIVCIYSPVASSVSQAGGFGAVVRGNALNGGLFIGLGVLSTAMACQHSSFLISNTLRDHTPARWAKVSGISLVTATAMSLSLGVAGYLGFLDDTQGDVLKNFGQAGPVVNAGRALLCITMFLTYPMESFVARHVIGQLLFDGNMDNTCVDSQTGLVVPEINRWLGCLGRRERWTIYLYIAALIPALILKDLGPVLSLTGSLGASSIAYIAPGLVYLGLNGDDFLAWVGRNVPPTVSKCHDSNHGRSQADGGSGDGGGDGDGTGSFGEVELPVAGDAKATLKTVPEPTFPPSGGRKPWWWWPTLMPIWVAIASSGARGCQTFMRELQGESGSSIPMRGPSEDEDDHLQHEVIGPCKSDYIYSMVFVVFGVVAMVAGVVSNVYVQIHNIFYTPT